MSLLSVNDLRVHLKTPYGAVAAVRGVNFDLARGQALGLVGESGCGKSLTALALMGLLPESAQVSGAILLDGQELTIMTDEQRRRLRGNRMAMVFQEPMTALNPLHTVGQQIAEPLRLHKNMTRHEAHAEALRLLARVGIAHAAKRMDAYPHQFSGGQRQRITIAMALACQPDVLVADEPTTALDVTVAGQILELIHELVDKHGMGLILISHDLGLIAQNVDQVLVMYGGTVVESGRTRDVFTRRAHPYTQGLFASRPQLVEARDSTTSARHPRQRLAAIPGTVPELHLLPKGCPFCGRCTVALPQCETQIPPVVQLSSEHSARCFLLHQGAP